MTKTEHIERHVLLHRNFDELMTDFMLHTGRLPSKATLMELAAWAYQQAIEPDELPGDDHGGD